MADVHRARPGEVNYNFLDRWSLAHAAWGALASIAGASALQALGASVAWETIEPTLKRNVPDVFPSASIDSIQNKVGDTASWMLGWAIAEKIKTRRRRRGRRGS